MNRLVLMSAMVVSLGTYAFFNMPQQMMTAGSQMMFPAQDIPKQPCVCVCGVK